MCTQCAYWGHFNENTSRESRDPNVAPCWSNLSTFGCCSCGGHAIKIYVMIANGSLVQADWLDGTGAVAHGR